MTRPTTVDKRRIANATMSERAFQKHLVTWLRQALPSDVFMTHFPAGRSSGGGKAGFIRGAQLKGMGLVPGVPDLLFIYKGRAYWMELKAGKNSTSLIQDQCITHLFMCGSDVEVIRTLAQAFAALDSWGIPTKMKVAA